MVSPPSDVNHKANKGLMICAGYGMIRTKRGAHCHLPVQFFQFVRGVLHGRRYGVEDWAVAFQKSTKPSLEIKAMQQKCRITCKP